MKYAPRVEVFVHLYMPRSNSSSFFEIFRIKRERLPIISRAE